jgi:hypothetical protein
MSSETTKELLGHDRISATEHYVEGKGTTKIRPDRCPV